jgi:XFP N-terminal domain
VCSRSPGPGHGAPATLANCYLEGHYSAIYPEKLRRRGHAQILPAVLASRRNRVALTPETPGSIHEGRELGYSISHTYCAAFDNPNLISQCWSATVRRDRSACYFMAFKQVPESDSRRGGTLHQEMPKGDSRGRMHGFQLWANLPQI